jgi:hypothetical protein
MTNGRRPPQLSQVRAYLARLRRPAHVRRDDVLGVRKADQVRVRLLIDVMWPDDKITDLGELAAAQVPVQVTGTDEGAGLFLPGRLMGATPVEATGE